MRGVRPVTTTPVPGLPTAEHGARPAAAPDEGWAPDRRAGWAVVAALFVVAVFAWGLAFYGLGFYLRELHRIEGWSLSYLSAVTFVFYGAATVATFLVGRLLVRHGPRPVFVGGAVLLGGGLLAIGNVRQPWQLLVAYLVLAGGWSCLNLYPISATVLAWFPQRSSTPLAVALTGASMGGIVLIPVLDELNASQGFGTALGTVGVVALVVVGALSLLVVRRPPGEPAPAPAGGTAPASSSAGAGTAAGAAGSGSPASAAATGSGAAWRLLREGRFWLLLSGLALGFTVQVGFLVHQLNLLDATTGDGGAARIVSITTAAALAGRLVFVAIGDRWPTSLLGAAYLAAQAAALVAVAHFDGDGAVPLGIACAVFGLGVGVLITIPPLLTRTVFPDIEFTAAFPVLNAGLQVAVAGGAPLMALGHDVLGGYGGAALVGAAVDAVGVALLLRVWRRGA